jgi:hypothetical protein
MQCHRDNAAAGMAPVLDANRRNELRAINEAIWAVQSAGPSIDRLGVALGNFWVAQRWDSNRCVYTGNDLSGPELVLLSIFTSSMIEGRRRMMSSSALTRMICFYLCLHTEEYQRRRRP